jgi:ankyrin repeat protein
MRPGLYNILHLTGMYFSRVDICPSKIIKIDAMLKLPLLITMLTCFVTSTSIAQSKATENELLAIFLKDDVGLLDALIGKAGVNYCHGQYTLLAHAIRFNAKNCFDRLIEKNADVNRICEGYIPPLMHAAKYGRIEFAKTLVAKGAKRDYMYEGIIDEIKGMTPIKYAEHFQQNEVSSYLKSLEK